MNETAASAKVCRELEELGALTLSITPDQRGGTSWPDKYVAHVKWSGFLEFKIGTRQTTRFQKHMIAELKRRGVNVWVVRVVSDGFVIENENGVEIVSAVDVGQL